MKGYNRLILFGGGLVLLGWLPLNKTDYYLIGTMCLSVGFAWGILKDIHK